MEDINTQEGVGKCERAHYPNSKTHVAVQMKYREGSLPLRRN